MTEPWRAALSDRDALVIGECLRALASGDFLDGDEHRIRTGLTLAEMRRVAEAWPGPADPDLTLDAVRAALIELALGLPFDEPQWRRHLTVSPGEVREVLDHVDAACGRTNGPLGEPVPSWVPRATTPHTPMTGRYVALEPLRTDHAEALYECTRGSGVWAYLAYGPWSSAAGYADWISSAVAAGDPQFYAVLVGGEPRGVVSLLRIDPANGVAEIGHVWYAPSIQRTPATTEATYLVARRVFDECGYRRFEWKCNALNAPSRRAAERFGFAYEGTFRQHMVVKGRNRDTAWFAMTDGEWPAIRVAFERWLDPANFDGAGRQRDPLRCQTGGTSTGGTRAAST